MCKAALLKLAEQGMTIISVHEWTDGSAAQYKGKNAFADITDKMIPTIRNYFVTSHGQNVCDGLGAGVKNMALRHIIGGNITADAEGNFASLRLPMTHDISTGMVKLTYPGENLYLSKHWWWIAKGPRSRHWMAHVNCMQYSVLDKR